MSARLCRTIVALALAPWFVVAAAMPQEHLHEADADHPQSLVHRHAALHAVTAHDHDGAEFDHREDRVLWLSDASLVRAAYQFDISWAAAERPFELPRDLDSWLATGRDDASPPHGPPRPSRSPRAPPLASRLN